MKVFRDHRPTISAALGAGSLSILYPYQRAPDVSECGIGPKDSLVVPTVPAEFEGHSVAKLFVSNPTAHAIGSNGP